MTRRKVIFTDPATGNTYITPEFNGDKAEMEFKGKGLDSCDMNWDEIYQERFVGVKTLNDFIIASDTAQMDYHSFLGVQVLPIQKVEDFATVSSDYVINLKDSISKSLLKPISVLADEAWDDMKKNKNGDGEPETYLNVMTYKNNNGIETTLTVRITEEWAGLSESEYYYSADIILMNDSDCRDSYAEINSDKTGKDALEKLIGNIWEFALKDDLDTVTVKP